MDRVDDMQESELISHDFWKKYLFLSCWTSESHEIHGLWNYHDLKGVRIGLPEFPFKVYKPNLYTPPIENVLISPTTVSYVPFEYLYTPNHLFIAPPNKDFWIGGDVAYFNNPMSMKLPSHRDENGFYFNLGLEQARIKDIYWKWQAEYRYLLYVLPSSPYILETLKSQNGSGFLAEYLKACLLADMHSNINDFYLELSEAIYSIEIMIGPCCSDEQRCQVYQLVEQYAPNAKITNSRVTGKIRDAIRN